MTKPVIVTRAGKGSALTWVEGDANFTNLQDATFTITDGTTPVVNDLNSTLTLVPGANILLTMDNTTKTITIDGTAEDQRTTVLNNTGSTLTKGQLVYISGAQGTHPTVALAQANAEMTSAGTIGFVYADITDGNTGYIQTGGSIKNINTAGFTEGAMVYLSAASPGAMTQAKPTAPNHLVVLGWVTVANAISGRVQIKVDNGYELEELHNVLAPTPTDKNVLKYDATGLVWTNGVVDYSEIDNAPASIYDFNITDGAANTLLATDGAAHPYFTAVKTINGTSLLGAGNISISTGGGIGSLTAFNANGTQDDLPINAFSALTDISVSNELVFGSSALIAQGTTGTYGWSDMMGQLVIKGSGATSPSWVTLFGNMEGIVFSATAMQQAFVELHLNHDYALGTSVYPHVHWTPTTTTTGTVRWGFEYTVAKGHQQATGSVFNTTTTTVYVEQVISTASQWKHFIAEVATIDAIPSTDLEPDSVIKIRVFRDAAHVNDTYTGTVHAWQVDAHYQTNRLSTINKAPNFYGA